MSIVIAKRTKDGFVFGADSGCFKDQKRSVIEKIFKLDYYDDVYVGCVGFARDSQVIRYMENLIDPNAVKRDVLDIKSIVTYTVPSLKKQLSKATGDGKPIDRWESECIIVRKDKAFLIEPDFSVEEIEDFKAIGAPEDFCTGAYNLLCKYPLKTERKEKGVYRYKTIKDEKIVV